MFELQQERVFIAHVNPRAEKHGDDNKLATDIKVEVTLANTALDDFNNGLRPALYCPVPQGEQPDLIDDNEFGGVRFPLIGAIKWDEDFPGYRIKIESELGLAECLELGDITLKKFSFEPLKGGSVNIVFTASCHPNAEECGDLCALIQSHANLTLVAPTAAEQKESQGDILDDQDAQDKARADAVGDALDSAA